MGLYNTFCFINKFFYFNLVGIVNLNLLGLFDFWLFGLLNLNLLGLSALNLLDSLTQSHHLLSLSISSVSSTSISRSPQPQSLVSRLPVDINLLCIIYLLF
jgi:hypothetical protein